MERRFSNSPTFAETTPSTCALTSCTTSSNIRQLGFPLTFQNTNLTGKCWLAPTKQRTPPVGETLQAHAQPNSVKAIPGFFAVRERTSKVVLVSAPTAESATLIRNTVWSCRQRENQSDKCFLCVFGLPLVGAGQLNVDPAIFVLKVQPCTTKQNNQERCSFCQQNTMEWKTSLNRRNGDGSLRPRRHARLSFRTEHARCRGEMSLSRFESTS